MNTQNDVETFKPMIMTRLDPNVEPKYKVLSRQLHADEEPTLTMHTAGDRVLWEISIREAAQDKELLAGMCESDKKIVTWVYENDLDVDNYHYKK